MCWQAGWLESSWAAGQLGPRVEGTHGTFPAKDIILVTIFREISYHSSDSRIGLYKLGVCKAYNIAVKNTLLIMILFHKRNACVGQGYASRKHNHNICHILNHIFCNN